MTLTRRLSDAVVLVLAVLAALFLAWPYTVDSSSSATGRTNCGPTLFAVAYLATGATSEGVGDDPCREPGMGRLLVGGALIGVGAVGVVVLKRRSRRVELDGDGPDT